MDSFNSHLTLRRRIANVGLDLVEIFSSIVSLVTFSYIRPYWSLDYIYFTNNWANYIDGVIEEDDD